MSDRQTAQEFGYTGTEYADFDFLTVGNDPGRIKIRSMELEYNQSLSFLGEKFKRLSVRGSYTRLYAEVSRPDRSSLHVERHDLAVAEPGVDPRAVGDGRNRRGQRHLTLSGPAGRRRWAGR